MIQYECKSDSWKIIIYTMNKSQPPLSRELWLYTTQTNRVQRPWITQLKGVKPSPSTLLRVPRGWCHCTDQWMNFLQLSGNIIGLVSCQAMVMKFSHHMTVLLSANKQHHHMMGGNACTPKHNLLPCSEQKWQCPQKMWAALHEHKIEN